MRSNTSRCAARIVAIMAGATVPAFSAWGADNCTGTYSHVLVSVDKVETAAGMTITSFQNRGSSSSADSVYEGAGSCAGFALATPDGKRTVQGACTRKNKDGDAWSFTWAYGPSGTDGTWQSSGGTGAFAGKKSSGWFKLTMRDGEISMGTWGGTCE